MTPALLLVAWLVGAPVGMLPHQHCYHASAGPVMQYAINRVYDARPECNVPEPPTPRHCCWCDAAEPQPQPPPLPEHCKLPASSGHGPFYPRQWWEGTTGGAVNLLDGVGGAGSAIRIQQQ